MLREYLIGEAMHALGIPDHARARRGRDGRAHRPRRRHVAGRGARHGSRRATCASARSSTRPGSATATLLRRLADHAIARHYPDVADAAQPYAAFYEQVVEAQASLVARWMLVGFIHGVMNTDNMTISGETIDYGPCAFMDAYDPATVFSSIDHGGRYAYGRQPSIAQWNLARLGRDAAAAARRRHRRRGCGRDRCLMSFPIGSGPLAGRACDASSDW